MTTSARHRATQLSTHSIAPSAGTTHPSSSRKKKTMATRTARNGPVETGEGQVELSSSKLGTYDVSFPKRASEEANGSTSPEELLAAAHSACYAMQLSAIIGAAGA